MVEDALLAGAVQVVHDAGHVVDTAQLDVGCGHHAGELALHLRLDNLDGGGGGALHGGDGLHHLYLTGGLQLLDDAGGLVRVHIAEDQSHGLGTLVLQRGVQGLHICLVQEGEVAILQGLGNLFQQGGGGLLTEGLLQYGLGVLQTALGDGLVGEAALVELGEHRLGLLAVEHS